jgi:hypothetical protein
VIESVHNLGDVEELLQFCLNEGDRSMVGLQMGITRLRTQVGGLGGWL